MKRTVLALILIGLTASPALAQGRGRNKQGVPPGQQPPPTSCYEAERIASRDRGARVIYGNRTSRNAPVYRDERGYPGDIGRGDDRRYPGDDRRDPSTDGRRPNPTGQNRTGRAVPRGEQYPDTYPYPDARYPQGRDDYGYGSHAFRGGYDDGIVKGREDLRDGDRYDPARHGWYRSADRGYNSRYGSREDYRAEYRRGFLAGYENAHPGTRR